MMNTGSILKAFCAAALFTCLCRAQEAKEPKTIITGEQMEMTGGGKTVIFTGAARVVKGVDELTADRIVQDKKNNKVEAEGNVVFKSVSKDNEPFRGSSQKAFYDLNGERGELSGGKPEILYYMKTSTSPVIFRADDITFDNVKQELYGKNNVEIITSSITAYAPEAVLEQKEKKVILTGPVPQPFVIYSEGGRKNRYRADKITFFASGNKVQLKGNVRAVMTVEDKNAKAKGK